MKKYMFRANVLVQTDDDFEIWHRETSDEQRKLIYKRSDPSTHDNPQVKRILADWEAFEDKDRLELVPEFKVAGTEQDQISDSELSEIGGSPV